ncbi:uncharacterized protein MKK02DRAFT_39949 [Dioszegia hungarica]|uniref:Uncharacterized protein n=1 Tax=Dioszegia hungarica TaxID=4972 RepID=A0AA38HF74_9TREE|nr:uncharacterized protein MKK02DRAFT_39949 [Dioszegia hungarica]KAI9639625.1 hypothetical protein MKK02DRAFT_39949 [Dioszegia hungarica]
MSTMDELIQSMNGGAHVSQDLQALQEYLNQNIHAPALHPSSSAFRNLPPSRSTSTNRNPPLHLGAHVHSLSHESYLPGAYATPLQTPCIREDPSMPSSSSSRPRTLRRSSSYGFGSASGSSQSRSASPYAEFSGGAFEGDAFAPLVQPEHIPADPWAKWKQQSPESASAWSAFGGGGQFAQPKHMNGFGMGAQPSNHNHFFSHHQQSPQFGGTGRFQSPARAGVGRPPTPPDEDDEMMDMDEGMVERAMRQEQEEEDAVEREMMGMEDEQIVRPGSAPGAIEMTWREQEYGWERGRRNM